MALAPPSLGMFVGMERREAEAERETGAEDEGSEGGAELLALMGCVGNDCCCWGWG